MELVEVRKWPESMRRKKALLMLLCSTATYANSAKLSIINLINQIRQGKLFNLT